MDAFADLSILISIILGLAIAQLLPRVRGIVLGRARIRVYWVPVTWAMMSACTHTPPLATSGSASHADPRVQWLERLAILLGRTGASSDEFADLERMRPLIGNARIVLLGEQTHGDGNAFTTKIRIVRFLHERMGFDVLAMESGTYDAARVWADTKGIGGTPVAARGSIFRMYATTREMQPLFSYLDSMRSEGRTLDLVGFDSQHTGVRSRTRLTGELREQLIAASPDVVNGPQWNRFDSLSRALFRLERTPPTTEVQADFFTELAKLRSALAALPATGTAVLDRPGFWIRILGSIESQALRYWKRVSNDASTRDNAMAENINFLLATPFAGRKMIVWGHNGHLSRGLVEGASSFTSMGNVLARTHGAEMFGIGISAARGKYENYVDGVITDVPPPPPQSLESLWAQTSVEVGLVPMRGSGTDAEWLRHPFSARMGDYENTTLVWPDQFDAMLLFREVTPTSHVPAR
jgi:erythromycin esterase